MYRYVGVFVDSVLDGFVEDMLGLFSRQVHPWFKPRSGAYHVCAHSQTNFYC